MSDGENTGATQHYHCQHAGGAQCPDYVGYHREDQIINRGGEINAWDNAEFKAAIEAIGRKKIIMAGIVTDLCLMFPALSAIAEGYDVYAVIDASGTWNSTVQQATMHRMSKAGIKVTTWAPALAELMHDWRSPKGLELGGVWVNTLHIPGCTAAFKQPVSRVKPPNIQISHSR